MLKFVFLSDKFYADYSGCPEIEQKKTRPYIQVEIMLDGVLFCVPLRSSIKHNHVLWTDKANRCGIDFTKAVIISDPENYIDKTKAPYIRPNEFNSLRGKEYVVKEKLKKYIESYKLAKQNPDIARNKNVLKYSTLQYFEEYI